MFGVYISSLRYFDRLDLKEVTTTQLAKETDECGKCLTRLGKQAAGRSSSTPMGFGR